MIDNMKFSNPDAIYRPTPFWGLNGRLDAHELKRQIGLFHDKNFGGVYLHPRAGMETDYLSEEYFDALRICIEETEKLGMLSWLYDEDWCPSGKAGNKVARSDPGLAQMYIKKDAGQPRGYTIGQCHDASGNYRQVNVDVCNKEAIDRFIEITHEQYLKRFGSYFGNVIPAIFTDEPHFRLDDKDALPWTKDFEKIFFDKYGYDLLSNIDRLFADSRDGNANSRDGNAAAYADP